MMSGTPTTTGRGGLVRSWGREDAGTQCGRHESHRGARRDQARPAHPTGQHGVGPPRPAAVERDRGARRGPRAGRVGRAARAIAGAVVDIVDRAIADRDALEIGAGGPGRPRRGAPVAGRIKDLDAAAHLLCRRRRRVRRGVPPRRGRDRGRRDGHASSPRSRSTSGACPGGRSPDRPVAARAPRDAAPARASSVPRGCRPAPLARPRHRRDPLPLRRRRGLLPALARPPAGLFVRLLRAPR